MIQAWSLFAEPNMSRFASFGLRGLLALTFLDLSTVSLGVSSSSFARVFPFGGLGTFALAFETLGLGMVAITLSSTLSC